MPLFPLHQCMNTNLLFLANSFIVLKEPIFHIEFTSKFFAKA